MTFSAPGSTGWIWRTARVVITRVSEGGVVWDRYDIDAVRVSHVAALLLQQGVSTSWLFPPDGYFSAPPPGTDIRLDGGAFLFLAGRVVLSTPPPWVEEVTLARVLEAPSDLQAEQLLGRLVEQVLRGR